MKKLALYLLFGAALVGCGGDDSNSDFSDNDNDNLNINLPAGFYTGTTNEGQYLEGVVDDDSKMWVIYSKNESFYGFIKSDDTVVLNNSKFNVSGKDYFFDSDSAYDNITINGSYKVSKAIMGKVIESNSDTTNFNIGYEETTSARKHTLNLINNRTYNLSSYVSGIDGSSATTVTFTTDGNFTGFVSEGCTISGNLTPSASEKNFVTKMTFSGTPCYDAGYKVGENYTGVAVVDIC